MTNGRTLTSVVASKMTPKRFVDLAKLTASLTESDLKSTSSSGSAGTSEASVLFLEIPQYDAKNTASDSQPTFSMRYQEAILTIRLFPIKSSTDSWIKTAKDDLPPWTRLSSLVYDV
jgi:hypothetical protein